MLDHLSLNYQNQKNPFLLDHLRCPNSADCAFLPLVSGAFGSRSGTKDFLRIEVIVIKPFCSSAAKNLFACAGLVYEVAAITSFEVKPSGLSIAVASVFISSGVETLFRALLSW